MADVLGVIKNQLVVTFKSADGNHAISFPNPKRNLSEAQIKTLADHVIANGYITTANGEALTGVVKAKVVSTDTDKFDLV